MRKMIARMMRTMVRARMLRRVLLLQRRRKGRRGVGDRLGVGVVTPVNIITATATVAATDNGVTITMTIIRRLLLRLVQLRPVLLRRMTKEVILLLVVGGVRIIRV